MKNAGDERTLVQGGGQRGVWPPGGSVAGAVSGGCKERYPDAFAALPPEARRMAVERANVLIARGCDAGRACRMALTTAQEWAECGAAEALPGPAQHLMYEYDAWLICPEDTISPTHAFDRFADALARVQEIAAERRSVVFVYGYDGLVAGKYERYGGAQLGGLAVHVQPWQSGWTLSAPVASDATRMPYWLERKEGRAWFATRAEAVADARRVAMSQELTLVVHLWRDAFLWSVHE